MIETAIHTIQQELNTQLKTAFQLAEDILIVRSPLQDLEKHKLILSLVKIEEDSSLKSTSLNPSKSLQQAPISINLYLLFAASIELSNSEKAYKYLSEVVRFFHNKPLFNPQNSPNLGNGALEKISMELVNQSFEEQSQMWSMLGSPYLPSLVYRVRILSLGSDSIQTEIPNISGLES